MTEKRIHPFDEVEFGGEQLELHAVEHRTWIPHRWATLTQPAEGGEYETDSVEVIEVVVERAGKLVTLKRPQNPSAWWKQLDAIADQRVEEHYESN